MYGGGLWPCKGMSSVCRPLAAEGQELSGLQVPRTSFDNLANLAMPRLAPEWRISVDLEIGRRPTTYARDRAR